MATAVARYTAAALTDRGRKRASNEDAFGYSVEHGVYLVCDGMGGAAAGEIASSLAIEEVLRLITSRIDARPNTRPDVRHLGAESSAGSSDNLPQIAAEAVAAANQTIHSRGQRNPRLSGMGTTLVGLLAGLPGEEAQAWIVNVGDSRCYRFRQGRIKQISRDHSLVDEQVRLGRMTRAEAARSPLRNVITRALGTQPGVTPDVIEAEVEPGDIFLLCSDGLTRELADDKLESLLKCGAPGSGSEPTPLEEICNCLIQAANKAGGNDNITCLLVRVD